MIDTDLCGMVSQEIVNPESLLKNFDYGGCLGPNKKGFEIKACIDCTFYPKLEVINLKIDMLDKLIS